MGKVMPSVRFLLIRHGETTWNQENRWQGQADVPLSDAGRAQSRLLAQRLLADRRQLHAIYASDLSRAFETAEILSQILLPLCKLIQFLSISLLSWVNMLMVLHHQQYINFILTFHLGIRLLKDLILTYLLSNIKT